MNYRFDRFLVRRKTLLYPITKKVKNVKKKKKKIVVVKLSETISRFANIVYLINVNI